MSISVWYCIVQPVAFDLKSKEKAIANFLTLKAGAPFAFDAPRLQTGNLLMRNSDGSTTDTLETAGKAPLDHLLIHVMFAYHICIVL